MAKKKRNGFKENQNFIIIGGVVIIALIAIALFSSTSAPVDVPQDVQQEVPAEPEVEEEPSPIVEAVEEIIEDLRQPNPDLESLFQRTDSVKSMSYNVITHGKEFGDVRATGMGVVELKGDKARIEPVSLVYMSGKWSADFVYVNYATEKAIAYCISVPSCDDKTKKGGVEFSEYATLRPTDWIESVKYGEKIAVRQYNDRPVQVIGWEDEGLYYEAFVDSYYGMPMRVYAYEDIEKTKLHEGWEYQGFSFNTVKDSDVEMPY